MSRRPRSWLVLSLVAAVMWSTVPAPASAAGFSGTFDDDDRSVHESAIEAIAAEGVTRGCNPPANDRFCPESSVTRGQMAAFLRRALTGRLQPGEPAEFVDDDTSEFEADIEWLASVDVTRGCNPPANDRFCPNSPVTRGQMAAFLSRALELTDRGDKAFVDDDRSVFEQDIERLATAGITVGCNPPANDRFCPERAVTRAEMATFLARGLGYPLLAPQVSLSAGWSCSKDGLTCSGAAVAVPGRTVRVEEGWTQALPFLSGEESAFRANGTRFELRIDGKVHPLTALSPSESGSKAHRDWRTTLTLPQSGSTVIEARWYWEGELTRRTRIAVSIS